MEQKTISLDLVENFGILAFSYALTLTALLLNESMIERLKKMDPVDAVLEVLKRSKGIEKEIRESSKSMGSQIIIGIEEVLQ